MYNYIRNEQIIFTKIILKKRFITVCVTVNPEIKRSLLTIFRNAITAIALAMDSTSRSSYKCKYIIFFCKNNLFYTIKL